jgi:signal transduction histidine kinase
MLENIAQENIYQLVYASKVAEGFSEKDLIDILRTSRKNNKAIHISGALVYNKGYFLQMIEGEQVVVDALFKKITQDVRHEKISRFYRGTVPNRVFPDWYMGFFQNEADENIDLSELVNLCESQHPASQFFLERLLEVQKKLLDTYHTTADSVREINWIIEEVCSSSMRLIFDMMHDTKLATHTLRLKLGFDSLSVGVIVTDLKRNIAYINHSAVKILSNAEEDIRSDLPNFNVDDLLGKNIDLFHKNPAHQINILDQLTNTVESIITLGGRFLSIKVTAISDEFEQPMGYMAEVEDITIKEKNKADLEKSIEKNLLLNNQVNQLQRVESISRLTAGIAHDFNNILAAITGYNQLNRYSIEETTNEKLKEEVLFNTDQVEIASQRGINLIKKMMAYTRQNPVNKEIDIKPTLEVIEEVLALLRPTLTSKFDLNKFIHSTVEIYIDAIELHQILTNLIVNARDAMKAGGIITVSLKKVTHNKYCTACTESLNGPFVELAVSDTGSGIEKGVITHIFDPFFTTKPVGEGTGLGLSTVSGMVHEAQGHIIVESKTSGPNSGTVFKLLFPLR